VGQVRTAALVPDIEAGRESHMAELLGDDMKTVPGTDPSPAPPSLSARSHR
jgi:hypothetical protein